MALTRSEAITRILAGLPICERDVRMNVARNVNAPVEVRMVLAKDEDEDVRWDVAGNVNAPVELLMVLVKSEDEGVRRYVAGFCSCLPNWTKFSGFLTESL